MTEQEFIVERDRRAQEKWEHAIKQASGYGPIEGVSILVQYLMKDIASCQMMIEELVKHTKMNKLDEI